MRKAFNASVKKIYVDLVFLLEKIPDPDSMSLSYLDDEDEDPVNMPDDNPLDANGKAIYENPFTDILIHSKFLLPQGDHVRSAKVQGRTKEDDGNIVGTFDSNPILNSILYYVEVLYGAVKQYAVNFNDDNMYSQVGYGGHSVVILDVIVD